MDRHGDDDLMKKPLPSGSRLLSECLVRERSKGLEMLREKTAKNGEPNAAKSTMSTKSSSAKTTVTYGNRSPVNKENICQNSKKYQSDLFDSNSSDYVPYRQREAIDISDLITNVSITLQNTPSPALLRLTDVSFHAAEMTGRSTLHTKEPKPQKSTGRSVDDILASSFVDNVREMRKSLAGFGSNILDCNRFSTDSSCISGFSAMQKNPRPTNIESKSVTSNEFSGASFTSNIFRTSANDINGTFFDDEEKFAPADEMQNKLLQDEISWAKTHAIMPTKVLSEDARKKLTSYSTNFNDVNQSNVWNSMLFNDTNFSVGNFFAKRSDNIANVIQEDSDTNEGMPIALISDDTITTTTVTSPIESLNCNKAVGSRDTITLTPTKCAKSVAEPHDSKDSGNATSKSDLLSLSEIDRALDKLRAANDSRVRISSNKSYMPLSLDTLPKIAGDPIEKTAELNALADILSENKENIQSDETCSNEMANTLSFTESLLNTSIQNYRMSNAGQARSPLSPIPIVITEKENDADIDEFANSPLVTANRRKRFSKSPKSSVNNFDLETIGKGNEDNVDVTAAKLTPMVTNGKKSLCSTRLDSDRSSPTSSSANFSPNFSKNSRTLTPTYHKNNSSSINAFEMSPLSSPCSYPSSAANSPSNGRCTENRSSSANPTVSKNCRCSPQFDTTTNSDFRYLNAVASASSRSLRRVVSPSQSENGNAMYCGAPPVRTYSSNSVKSTSSTSTRSVSRCSNNSEFSHRDGKLMPLKATALELSWASTKLRTDSHKSMQVKNTSDKRLVVRIEINGPGFQLISPESNMLTLQSQECRTIVVNFYPTVIGPAIGRLVFQPPKSLNTNNSAPSNANNTLNNEITIPLYAYGGNASIIIQHLLRGPVGEPFLPMGEFCTLIRPLERSFEIYNRGPLMGFAAIYIEPIRMHVPEISNSFEVYPEYTLIEPNTAVTIRLVFQPSHSDLRKIRKIINDVLTLAKLRIVYGDEAIRQRLRQIQRTMNAATRESIFTKSLDKLWTRFPGEQTMFSPGLFKDNANVARDMWACISEQEVALTLNNNMLDETAAELSTIFTEADNTILFRTVCVSSPSNQLETVDELLEETHALNTARGITLSSAAEEIAISSTSFAYGNSTATKSRYKDPKNNS